MDASESDFDGCRSAEPWDARGLLGSRQNPKYLIFNRFSATCPGGSLCWSCEVR